MFEYTPLWSKEETNELFDLCKLFNLNFYIISDRILTNRPVEECKARFYEICKILLNMRSKNTPSLELNPL
jgi:DNA methyltransferase 1-associated protein 1